MIRRRVSALPAAVTAGLLAVAALLVPAAPAAAAESDTVYSLLNDSRWANGQAGLLRNASLDQVAADWAAGLAASGTLAHNPDYAAQIPGGWSNAGENVAQGQPDAGSMHAAWMASPGHRANILGDYTDVGIAFLAAGGTTWGVQVFASYPGHAGPAAPVSGAVSGSQVAQSPAPGDAADARIQTADADADTDGHDGTRHPAHARGPGGPRRRRGAVALVDPRGDRPGRRRRSRVRADPPPPGYFVER
jgi:hypothetical protein